MKVKQNNDRGNALVVTLITIAVVSGFIALAIDYTRSVGRNVQRSTLMRQAINIGDSATEMAFASWRAICIANSSSPAPAAKYFDSQDDPGVPDVVLPSPSPGNFPGVSRYVLLNYKVVPLIALNSAKNPLANAWSTPSPSPIANVTPSKIMGPNPQNYSYYYLATADVIVPTMTENTTGTAWQTDNTNRGNVVAHVKRVFEKYRHNKTDKAIDYKDDLEIHPGPNFVVNGDVHTSGNFYTGHATLTLNGSNSFSGSWDVGFMPGDGQHPEKPASPKFGASGPPSQEPAEVSFGVAADDYHKLIEPVVPSTDPLYPYSYSNNANYTVKIEISDNPDPTKPDIVKIYNSSGKDITSKTGNNADGQLATLIQGAITTNQNITDKRQGAETGNATVRVATLDVGAISTAITNGDADKVNFSDPVIYIADTSAVDPKIDPTKQRAIRLSNGGTLPPDGLTVASGNPVYIQGDYNTGSIPSATAGATPTVQPPTNTQPTPAPGATPPNPSVANYDRKPAAVIADAVTVLSNSWKDSSSSGNLSARKAAATTVNTAIIAGIVPSGGGYYSGGAENFPRFIEDWTGKTFTYYGSMIELYTSKQGIGRWGAADVYGAPVRAWYFDTNFLSNPPAGVPYDIDYRRSRWYMD